MTFRDEDRTSLQSIKSWILGKIPLIDSLKTAKVPFENADVYFINSSGNQNKFVSELDLHPVFKRTQYVKLTKRLEISNTNQEDINNVVLGKPSALNAMIEHFQQRIGIPIVQPTNIKPISREINESLVPIQLIIYNNGQKQLRDLRLQIWCDDEVRSSIHR